MCNPVAFVAASVALQLYQQQEQANAVNKSADNQEKNIHTATAQAYNQLNRKGVEDAQNQAQEQERLSREMAERVGTGRAQAGASGISGTSVNSMLLDLAGRGLEAKATAATNYARTVDANNDQASEIEQNAKGQLAGIQRAADVGFLDVLGGGLKIGSAYYAQKATAKQTSTGSSSSTTSPSTTSRAYVNY
jgi:hypothetical protein